MARKVHHCLYRMFSAGGELLYVGKTMNPSARFRQHRIQQSWWPTVAQITVDHFTSANELTHAERLAIATEGPLWNSVRYDAQPAEQKAPRRRRYSSRCTPSLADEVA